MSQNRLLKLVMFLVIIVVLLGVVILWQKPHWVPAAVQPSQELPPPVPIDISNQPTMGSKAAPIQIVSFEDFKCMNCRFFDVQLLPWLIQEYVKPGKASYTAITVSFLPDSMQAAVAARCIYQQNPQQFFAFSDVLFHNQGDEMTNWANTAKLLQWSNQLKGIDHEAFSACLLDTHTVNTVIKNTQYGMDIMGGSLSTPAVYINGVLVRPLTQQHIKEVIRLSPKHQEAL